jgi:hypothetical protein
MLAAEEDFPMLGPHAVSFKLHNPVPGDVYRSGMSPECYNL